MFFAILFVQLANSTWFLLRCVFFASVFFSVKMKHHWLFLIPDGFVVEIYADRPFWNKPPSIYEKLMLQKDERVILSIGDKNVECIFPKQGTKSDWNAKKESLLKNASFSPLVLSEIASTSNLFDVSINVENASEHSFNPKCQTPWPGSKSTWRRAASLVTCGHTSSSSFSQILSSEPTPSKVRRKTVLQVGVNNVVSLIQSNSCLLNLEKKTTITSFWHEVKEIGWMGLSAVFFQCCKNHIELAEVFRQSEQQLASSLTKYEDVMQSQNDDLEEQNA